MLKFKTKHLDAAGQRARMLTGSIPRVVTTMAIPTMLNQMISILYNTADTYFVSHLGNSASAAVGISFSLMSLIQACACGISVGGKSLISRRLGAGDNHAAQVIASTTMAAELVIGVVLMTLGLCFLEPLMRILGSTETMMPYACAYAKFTLLYAPLLTVEMAMSCILQAEGQAFFAMIGIISGNLLNVVLDPIFITTLGLSTGGAAIASGIGVLIGDCIMLTAFIGPLSNVRIKIKSVSGKLDTYMEILSNGIPTVVRQGVATISSTMLNRRAGLYGDAAIAAISVANKLYMMVRNLILGLGQGFQPVAGYNYGAKQFSRVKKSFKFCGLLGTGICLAASAFLWFNAETAIALFRDDPQVIQLGAYSLRALSLVLPLLGYSTFVNQMYQCLGFSLQATLLASCRQGILFIPALLLLHRFFGCSGVAVTQATADLATFLISVPFQIYFFRKVLSKADAPLNLEA